MPEFLLSFLVALFYKLLKSFRARSLLESLQDQMSYSAEYFGAFAPP
jgi:hypothetical protein